MRKTLLALTLIGTTILSSCAVAVFSPAPQNPYQIVADCDMSQLYLLRDKAPYKSYKCFRGTASPDSLPQPVGTWSASPNNGMLVFDAPWGKFGIYGGDGAPEGLDAYIKMYREDMAELLSHITNDTPITVEDGPLGVFGSAIRSVGVGDRGADVFAAQSRLREMGYFDGVVDGSFGEDLLEGLNRYQRDNQFPATLRIGITMFNRLGLPSSGD